MPYSIPAPAPLPLPIHSQGRPGHRRSYSDTRGPGAFAPLGLLPRRRAPGPKSAGATFHFRNDDHDHDDSSSPDDDDDDSDDRHIPNIPPVLRLKSPPPGSPAYRGLSINTTPGPVPFPRSHPSPSPHPAPAPTPPHVRPGVTRTTSTPIFLSNGKPLKSSLKSSSSSPSIASPTSAHSPHLPLPQPPAHLRARSAPTSPTGELEPEMTPLPSPTPSTHKNVHFPSKEQGGLETVRVFSRSARPASLSLSLPLVEDTETETETDRDSNIWTSTTPFPRVRSSLAPRSKAYAIDGSRTSPVPAPALDPAANIYLESLVLQSSSPSTSTSSAFTSSSASSSPPTLALTGTLLVRNLAYEKTVAVRFTLDDWHTTSEVAAHYRASLPSLPARIHRAGSGIRPASGETDEAEGGEEARAAGGIPQWDRFAFTIRLEDYHLSLTARTLWLVARYVAGSLSAPVPAPAPGPGGPAEGVPGTGEWWDNNAGGNYRVVFCEREEGEKAGAAEGEVMRKRRVAVSAPSSFSAPMTTPAHAHAHAAAPQGLLARSPSHTAQLAETTLQRLRKLSLKNYAAPASPAVSPGSETVPFGPQTQIQAQAQAHAGTGTGAQAPSSSSDDDEEDGPPTPAPGPAPTPHGSGKGNGFGFGAFGFGEMVGGFPATYPTLPGFEYEYDAGVGLGSGLGAGMGQGMGRGRGKPLFEAGPGAAAFEASTSPPGMSAFGASTEPMGAQGGGVGGSGAGAKGVALYWPWGTSHPGSSQAQGEASSSSSSSEAEPASQRGEGESGNEAQTEAQVQEEGGANVPSVRVSAPASPPPPPRRSSPTPTPAPARIHTFPLLRQHAHAHAPRTSSPLASPRVSPAPSPAPSPRASPAPSPRTSPGASPAASPTHSPAPSRTASLESVPEAGDAGAGEGTSRSRGAKARRVFPPEEPVVRRRPLLEGRAYTLAAVPAGLVGAAPRALALASGSAAAEDLALGEAGAAEVGSGAGAGGDEAGAGAGAGVKEPAEVKDSDSVYQAFVRQWCFAGAAAPPPPGLVHARAHSHTGVAGRAV